MSYSILAFNPGHDGAVALIEGGRLQFCIESEKDSEQRHSRCSATTLFGALGRLRKIPDVIAIGGWENGPFEPAVGMGYHGLQELSIRRREIVFINSPTQLFESTHERSHLFCAYGMSPFPQGESCYALIWEGQTGSFYELDHNLNILEFPEVVSNPGYKYAFLFDLADASKQFGSWNHASAGKLMALAAHSQRGPLTAAEAWAIGRILDEITPPRTDKADFLKFPFCNCGVTDQAFKDLVGKFSDALFERFYGYAKANLTKGYPLLISGGCGLNCEWNVRWKECGLFPSVFVPPVPNDSGSAIGTAVEAQYYLNGRAKIEWNVYCGAEFDDDRLFEALRGEPLDYDALAGNLARGRVAAWVHGPCEIGPRALGHRSLLAAPFDSSMRDRLNRIKMRESYRPIAPICLEDDCAELFGLQAPSPYMLEFQKVRSDRLKAVTHVDGSARVQTVSQAQNPEIYALLRAFKQITGFGVLCNTSLNFPGRGFINRGRDLLRYVTERGIEHVAVNGIAYDVNPRSSTA